MAIEVCPNELIAGGARAIRSLSPALAGIQDCPIELDDVRRAAQRGHFTPAEDQRVHAWFARYLTARGGLLEVVGDLKPIATAPVSRIDERTQLAGFAVAYASACLLVKAARFLVETFATEGVVQRKLNEAEPRFRIPRKQYTAIYRSLTSPANVWRLRRAIDFANRNRQGIESLASDEGMGPVLEHLHAAEDAVDAGIGRSIKARLGFRWHSIRRRRASAVQRVTFDIAEAFGRVTASIHNPWHTNRVTAKILKRIEALLEPGDVIVTRHDDSMTNLFLPGFWPHASLYLGSASVSESLGVVVSKERVARWVEPMRVLEARKDGVLLRELADTLAVDAVAVIRPALKASQIATAISEALTHEGKLYNFDFDFFRADRLVCTEVVYRAYDPVAGAGPLRFALKRRAGRLTLSAEDLLDMAVEERGFSPVAVFGARRCRRRLVTGRKARRILPLTYRDAG